MTIKWALIIVFLSCLSAFKLYRHNYVIRHLDHSPVVITKEELDIGINSCEPEFVVPAPRCADGMVEIQGEYCPNVKEVCLKWIDSEKEYPMMCAEFEFPTKCLSKDRIPMHFCIDKYEAQDKLGEIPEVFVNWFEANEKCEESGKRLCDVRELTLACEGPELKPYPYGYKRDITKCNIGHQWIDPNTTPFSKMDRRAPSGSFLNCKSDYGVYDIVGNVDEYGIYLNGYIDKEPYMSALFGGHYCNGVRNRCRDQGHPSITVSHGPLAENYEISYRCCSSVNY
jgi:formylglycine-generating enzyme